MTRDGQECSWAEWAVLLALHALEPEQEAAVADHVRSCAACQATVRDAEETFAAIGETAAVAPPPELRHRILAAVQEKAPPVTPPRIGSGRTVREAQPPQPGAARRGPRRWAVAAAAAVLVAAMAGGGIVVAQLDRQRDAATAQADTLGSLLAALTASPHAVLVDRDRHPVAAVVLGDAPRFYDLDLPPAPSGRVWVLWGARGQAMAALAAVPGGAHGGTAAMPVGRLGEYEAYLLTQEAAGPLPTRPGDITASGPVIAGTGS
jgi:Anti-sigma-K factor rskA